ncbi:Ubiquinone/menaquinone biosynthesis C-methylase UbiE [Flexibacter flexilis DSM 6793]|uniref:Ubiquinone/menaquinone biosynthesis C-methylase UbiE n=1 Tax=Flexibacter flexilis DSM 6793 TaxID=927664 RepID=A0A1I1K996_9BACT|nr:class I SAM-dependent methyltransferase [Flexibacter flexilis]SFC55268.1 Ubiquinone/menaquinone biosynthesis C-methylase UbiE [Flexibacter flexilis DSM 6793]
MSQDLSAGFTKIKCRPSSMHHYTTREGVLTALHQNLPKFKGVVLDVGCGNMPYKPLVLSNVTKATTYIGLDLDVYDYKANVYTTQPDLLWDGQKIPLDNESVDTVILTEVLEHCADPEAVLREIFRVLRPNGNLFLTVPFLWLLHEVPHDEYRYTPFSLRRHIQNAGFLPPELHSLGGWNRALAQMLGMWVGYGSAPRLLRKGLRYALFPLYWLLVRTDRPSDAFGHADMITGLSAWCTKPAN